MVTTVKPLRLGGRQTGPSKGVISHALGQHCAPAHLQVPFAATAVSHAASCQLDRGSRRLANHQRLDDLARHSVAAGHIGDRGQVVDAPSLLVVDICGGGTV